MPDSSLLSHDQFSLLGIILALAAYTAVVRQALSQKVHDPHKRTELLRSPAHSPSSFLARTLELLVVADGLLIVAGALLVLRTFLWARGQATEALWGWFDLDRLIVAQAGVAILFLAGLHVRAWASPWMSRRGPRKLHNGVSPETMRQVAEKLERRHIPS
ncbi:MAG: hypothetical protein D6690_00865 [Nitrospirae bacterium]|nr:MAG: hypothetical protein D6690_00865 [Nitrospirota bacterium]